MPNGWDNFHQSRFRGLFSSPFSVACALLVCFAASGQAAEAKAMPGDWLSYNHDMASTRYSLLTQINANNAATLKPAWTFSLKGEGPPPRFGGGGSEATPIVVNGVMYLPASTRVVALDAANGKEVWSYTTTAGRPSTRGVACWPGDKQNPPRIIFTAGRNLIALNATTGKIDRASAKRAWSMMVGASVLEVPVGPPGDTGAYDARTGAKKARMGSSTWRSSRG